MDGHKKASASMIDDCIDKFRQHEMERKRLRLLNGQRGSAESTSLELLVGGEGDPLSALNKNKEENDAPEEEDDTLAGKNEQI